MKSRFQFIWIFISLMSLLLLLFLASLSLGESGADLSDVWAVLQGRASQQVIQVIIRIRLPRLLACLLAGASLALSGCLLQTLTRNPLADSGILGVNAGAGMVVALVLAYSSLESREVIRVLPFLAMVGGCLTLFLVYHLAKRPERGLSPVRLIIAGVGISTMLSGAMVSIVGNVNRYKVDAIINWLSGRVTGGTGPILSLLAPILVILWILVYSLSHQLNILSLSDQTAQALGLHLPKIRLQVLVLSTALAALSVVLVGNITFVGLVSGHLARRMVGGNHRLFLLASMLSGMILLLFADSLGRVLLVGAGIPTGLLVAILGAPYFLYLMTRLRT